MKYFLCYNFYFFFQVQNHWHKYTEKMDRMVGEAFKFNVKWSLQELSRAINGDGKSAPNPLFRVKVILEGDKVRLCFICFTRKISVENMLFMVPRINKIVVNCTTFGKSVWNLWRFNLLRQALITYWCPVGEVAQTSADWVDGWCTIYYYHLVPDWATVE